MPKVSVLMAVYKTPEAYLRAAIESILAQTYNDFEFLILDDCPEDDREKIVNSVQEILDDSEKYNKMSNAINPYGDGKASIYIEKIILDYFLNQN